MVISAAFIGGAAIANAFMDRIETTIAFNQSIFTIFDPKIWCKQIAGDNHKFIPGTKYPIDAWHIAKTIMIFNLIAAIILYKECIWFIDFAAYGIVWITVFNIFFNKVFKQISKW